MSWPNAASAWRSPWDDAWHGQPNSGPLPLHPISNRTGLAGFTVPATGTGRTGSDTQMQRRHRWTAVRGANRVKFRYSNQYANGGGIGNGLGTLTLRAGLRISGANIVPITFSGARDVVIAPGATVESDWVSATLVAGMSYSDYAWVRFDSAQTAWPGAPVRASESDEYQEWGTSLADRTLTDWSTGTRYSVPAMFVPLDIVTDTPQTGPSILLLGDSISSAGSNDTTTGSWYGYVQRSLAASYPWSNIGASGLAVSTVAYSQRATRIDRFAGRGFTHCLCPLSTNDIGGNVGFAQHMSNFGVLKGALDAIGVKLIPFTPPPRTNATNDAVNASGGAEQWTKIQQVRDAMIANNGVGYGYFDLNAVWRDSANVNLWRTDLGSPTTDGIHPSTALHTAAVTALTAALPTLLA